MKTTGWIVVEACSCKSHPTCIYVAARSRVDRLSEPYKGVLLPRTKQTEKIQVGDDIEIYLGAAQVSWTPQGAGTKHPDYDREFDIVDGGVNWDHPDRLVDYAERRE